MCGICGVIRPTGVRPGDRATVDELNDRQRHRGPDGTTTGSGADAVLGQTRLAVVDLAGGRQPFTTVDGSVTVVFNGEIYNHGQLRRRYGLRTPDGCDGAILPELWQRLGPAMFAQLRGMYAIAVCDADRGTFTLARDPFGIKPLYYTRTPDDTITFASEPRTLLPLLPAVALRPEALSHYLAYGALDRDQSPFENTSSVPVNAWVQWDRDLRRRTGEVQPRLLDDLDPPGSGGLREAFLESVGAHLLADVPVALLLSSGLDSAALAWACAMLDTSLTCVTVDTGDGVSERDGAARVAARYGHRHEVLTSRPDDSLIERYFGAMQRPSIDGLNTFLVSKAIADLGLKVALSGLGGDETLAGYRTFRLLRYLPLLRVGDAMSLTPLAARLCRDRTGKPARLLGPAGPRAAADLAALVRRVLTDEQVAALGSTVPPGASISGRDTSARALSRAELTGYLGGTLLPDADAYSMAWSVELRVPYVDVQFIRAALAESPRRGVRKRGFAAALGGEGLPAVARAPKRGFTLPMERWMRSGPLASYVHDVSTVDAPVRSVLRPEGVDALLASWRRGEVGWSRAWLVASLDAWLRNLDARVPVGPVTAGTPDGRPRSSGKD